MSTLTRLRDVLASRRGAIDLGSIMVGVLVAGVVASTISASVYAVIPWSKDQAAKQTLASVAAAQAVYSAKSISNIGGFGMSRAHSGAHTALTGGKGEYGNLYELTDASLLPPNIDGLCVEVTPDASAWVGVIQSETGASFTATLDNPNPRPAGADAWDSCAAVPENTGKAPEPIREDATMKFTVTTTGTWATSPTRQCSAFALPARGDVRMRVNWGDGSTEQTFRASLGDDVITHDYAIPGDYNVQITGTFSRYGAYPNAGVEGNLTALQTASTPCITQVTEWANTETTAADGAYAGFRGTTGVVQPPATATSYYAMFYGAQNFNQDITGWNVSQVTDLSSAFSGAWKFNQPIGSWNVSNVTKMNSTFSSTLAYRQPLNSWNVSKVTEMRGLFNSSVYNSPLNSWNVSNVTTMNGMFGGTKSFNQSLATWNTANVTDMEGMFAHATAFSQPLSTFKTGKVTDMSNMFIGATKFNSDINSWDTSRVTDMSEMFKGATLFNQPLDKWKTGNVTSMFGMFSNAAAFNRPLNTWDTSKVTSLWATFSGATAFNQQLSNWNTSNVESLNSTFAGAAAFNQPLAAWNTGKVTNLYGTFEGATVFNQELAAWDTSKVTDMARTFRNAAAFNKNIKSWNVSQVTKTDYFRTGSPLPAAYSPF